MNREQFQEQFLKLSKAEKDGLTLRWLIDLVQNYDISISDIIETLSIEYKDLSNIDKFNKLAQEDVVSASKISRVFGYGYSKSINIIKMLLKNEAIKKVDVGYKIISIPKFKDVGKQLFKI